MNRDNRQSNVELLRIVLMYFIILFHLIVHSADVHSLAINGYTETKNSVFYMLIMSFISMSVNCFVFISGYYGIKFNIKSVISFVFQGLFYSVLPFIIIRYFIDDTELLVGQTWLKVLTPISHNTWWFLSAYLALYFLSPILNKGVDYLNKRQLLLLIGVLIYLEITFPLTGINHLVGHGIGLYPILVIYLIARFSKKYNLKIKSSGIFYIVSSILLFIISYTCLKIHYQDISWRLFTYASPFIIIGSFFFFFFFLRIRIPQNTIINRIAGLSFGVYLGHESPVVYSYIKNIASKVLSTEGHSSIYIILWLFITSACIFIIFAIIEKIRIFISSPILNYINSKIDNLGKPLGI